MTDRKLNKVKLKSQALSCRKFKDLNGRKLSSFKM